jgi:hypothetical protein
METKHTQGKWVFDSEGKLPSGSFQCSVFPEFDNDIDEIAVCWAKTEEECISNAKLIAAAPEMLEACERALQVLESENIFGQARLLLAAAIKKATE